MQEETKIVVLLGRLLELIGRSSEASDDHRTTLRALADLVGRRSAALDVDGPRMRVEGVDVPDDTPFGETVRARLSAHGISRIHVAYGTSAVDLVELVRALAATPAATKPAHALEAKLAAAGVVNVSLISPGAGSRRRGAAWGPGHGRPRVARQVGTAAGRARGAAIPTTRRSSRMSKMAIVVTSAPTPAQTIAVLRRVLPTTSVAEFRERMASGMPVVESVLFGNDYPEVAAQLLALMGALPGTGAQLRSFELREAEAFDPAADPALWEVTPEAARNILDSAREYG